MPSEKCVFYVGLFMCFVLCLSYVNGFILVSFMKSEVLIVSDGRKKIRVKLHSRVFCLYLLYQWVFIPSVYILVNTPLKLHPFISNPV